MKYTGKDWERAAGSFAKYHEEHARYGGASREFHELAGSFLRTAVADVRRETVEHALEMSVGLETAKAVRNCLRALLEDE